jgi:hypothetical protein
MTKIGRVDLVEPGHDSLDSSKRDYTARRPSTSGRLPRKRSNRHRHNGNRDIRGSLCTRRSLATQSARLWRAPREQKIAFRAMREMGVRGILIYYSNYKPRVWPFARQKYFRFFAEWQPSGRIRWVARPLDQTDVATCKRAPRPLPAVPNCRHNDDASVN